MKLSRTHSVGFTLIELMITVTIVGILAAIAIPSYVNYTRRSYFSEMVQATAPYVTGVANCYQDINTLTGCNGGTNHIPTNVTTATGNVASLTVSNGVITVVPVANHGIEATDTYILTPTLEGDTITWASSGGGVTSGYAK